MYEHPIYKSAVLMKDQEECDFAKDLCIKYELPIWEDHVAFKYVKGECYLHFLKDNNDDDCFYVDCLSQYEENERNIISLEDFEALCEELNPEQDINDIISTIKELNNIVNKNS